MELAPNSALPGPDPADDKARASSEREAPESGPVAERGDAATAEADFDSFLRLLTAQLRNQDPLKPIDSTQFVAQLASFSTVEQLIGTNARLDGLIAQADSADMAGFASWIGRQVRASDGSFVGDGEPVRFRVPEVPGAAALEAVVIDEAGLERRRFAVPAAAMGSETTWDGLDASGRALAGEGLRVEIVYRDAEAVLDRRAAGVAREVLGVRVGQDGPILELADGGTLSADRASAVLAAPEPEGPPRG